MSKSKKCNLFDHILVPQHILLDAEDAVEVLEQFRVKPYQIPHIKTSDPAVRALGAKHGRLIRIIRASQTAGQAITYRYVVEG